MSIKSILSKNILFNAVLCGVLLGEVGRIHISGATYLSVLDIAVFIFVLVTFLGAKTKSSPLAPSVTVATLGLFIFFIFTLVLHSSTVPSGDLITSALYPLRWLIYALIPVALLRNREGDSEILLRTFKLGIILLAILGFIQFLFFPNLGVLEKFGFDPHYYRLVSTWLDPNFVGAAFVLGILVWVNEKNRGIKIYSLVVLFIALLATFSRSSYLLFAVSGISYALLRRSVKLGILVVLAVGILYFSYTIPRQSVEKSRNIDRAVSASSRLTSYSQAEFFFQQHPYFGEGFNLIRYAKRQNHMIPADATGGNSGAGIDSSWLFILATTGLVGIVIYSAYWINIIALLLEPVNFTKKYNFHALFHGLIFASAPEHALVAFFVGWAIHSWFVNSLFFTPLMALWGISLGLVLVQKEVKD